MCHSLTAKIRPGLLELNYLLTHHKTSLKVTILLREMTHAPEKGTINELHFLAIIFVSHASGMKIAGTENKHGRMCRK